VKYLPAALFGSACVGAVAYCYPHLLQHRMQREIVRNNEMVMDVLATSSSGEVKAPPNGGGLFGTYL
jgi:hypothetical protein